MTLRLSYFVPPAPLIAAKADGMLHGIEVVETRTIGSAAQLTGLLEGSLDVVVTAIDNLFEWTRAGVDVRLVGQVEPTTPLGVFAAAEIESLPGLAGRRFAVDAFDNGFALVARCLLKRVDVNVEYVEVGGVGERLDALLAGEVAGTLLGPPFDTRALEGGMRELLTVQQVFPAFPGQGLVVRTQMLRNTETRELLKALRAVGLLPIDSVGLDLLTRIRSELGLLPPDVELRALCA